MELVREEDKAYRFGDWGIKYLFRGPNLDWGMFYLKPGTNLGAHYHHQVEEAFFILEGRGFLRTDGGEVAVEKGCALHLAPGEKHDLYAPEDSFLRGIFIKSPYLPEDKVDCSI
ncbi:MAG TPA: cupin domain-containing protein [Candidatus Atribacteria bacterium]|nr:cupin domain-containing protein [Candidatus Atribacteria bacterium]HQE24494.1 cupin domain-containing protein [Candidatus Atribacteria bacterium]